MTFKSNSGLLLQKFKQSGLVGQLIRGGLGSIVVRLANIMLGLVLVVVLARVLGPEGYGVYAYVFALISVLAIPAQFGLPKLVVRETAKAHVNENWGLMLGIWHWTAICATGISIIVGLMAAALALWWSDNFSELQLTTFFFGLILVPLIALGNLRGAALQGIRRVVLGQLPEQLLRPGLFVISLLILIAWDASEITASDAMGLHAIAAGVAFTIGAWLLFTNRPIQLVARPTPIYETHNWLDAALPLALTAGMQQINQNTDIIMLGFYVPAEDVGIYRVAVQGGVLVAFGLQTISMFISPYFTRLHVKEEYERLQQLVTIGTRVSTITALPAVIVFVFFGDEILRTFFGEVYVGAYHALLILAVGQLVNATFGNVGILLNMTGHQRDTLRGMAIAAVTNIILNYILIPAYGINGAAIATAVTLLVWNVVLWRSTKTRLGIQSFVLFKAV